MLQPNIMDIMDLEAHDARHRDEVDGFLLLLDDHLIHMYNYIVCYIQICMYIYIYIYTHTY